MACSVVALTVVSFPSKIQSESAMIKRTGRPVDESGNIPGGISIMDEMNDHLNWNYQPLGTMGFALQLLLFL